MGAGTKPKVSVSRGQPTRVSIAITVAFLLSSVAGRMADRAANSAEPRRTIAAIPLLDVRRVLEGLSPNVPPQFDTREATNWNDGWVEWLRQHEARLRQRLERGDEDSVVNLWMYGTSFT